MKNIRINVLGDSITRGSAASTYENAFVSLLKDRFATVTPYAIGGTRIARKRTPSINPVFDECFLDRFEEMGEADVVIVFGGTNDWGHGDCLLGEPTDEDEYTFYGALNSLMNKLKAKYKDAFVFFVTPLHRRNDDSLYGEGQRTPPVAPLSAFVERILAAAKAHGFAVLDLFNDKDMQPGERFFAEIVSPDGLHPSDIGHKMIADKMTDFINENVN